MDKVFYVETVFGPGGPFNRNGDLFELSADNPLAPNVVIAKNCWQSGDGGGGVFFWDPMDGIDDGGTVIVPGATKTGTSGPCWRRIFSGALSVKWFGAKGIGIIDDPNNSAQKLDEAPFIQNAIDAVKNLRGGVVYFPTGEYCLRTQIVLPKLAYGQPFPLTLRGNGPALHYSAPGLRNGTMLRWITQDCDPVSLAKPMLTYDSNDKADTMFHAIEDIGFFRGDYYTGGPIFEYPLVEGGANGPSRWRDCAIRNCFFFSVRHTEDSPTLITIYGGWNSVIENVMVDGGDTGLFLSGSSRMRISNFQTATKNSDGSTSCEIANTPDGPKFGGTSGTVNGIVIDGGDSHIISHCRFEGSSGTLIKITGAAINVKIESISDEGVEQQHARIDLDDTHNVNMQNLNISDIGTYGDPGAFGLRVSGKCTNVRLDGGNFGKINVEAGAKHVHMDHITLGSLQPNTIEIEDTKIIDEVEWKTVDVIIKYYENTISHVRSYTIAKGLIDEIKVNGNYMSVGTLFLPIDDFSNNGLFKGGSSTSSPIHGIQRGFYDGQIITLLLTVDTTFNRNIPSILEGACPIYLQSGDIITVPAGGVIKFIFRDEMWYEMKY